MGFVGGGCDVGGARGHVAWADHAVLVDSRYARGAVFEVTAVRSRRESLVNVAIAVGLRRAVKLCATAKVRAGGVNEAGARRASEASRGMVVLHARQCVSNT